MKVLLDESLPKRLKFLFAGHQVLTVPEQGWAGMKNGELLKLAESEFDVFVTVDQNLQFQQNLAGYEIGIVVLKAISNRFDDLQPLIPSVLKQIDQIANGELVIVEA